MNNGTDNIIEYTYSFREDEFSGKALNIIKNAGIEEEFKDIIPDAEPEKIRIHPEDFKEEEIY